MRKVAAVVVFGALAVSAQALFGASPTRTETEAARKWAAEHLSTKASALPFSFSYNGKPFGELLPGWRKSGHAGKDLTFTDPKTGLVVRCEAKEFSDVPAVEWAVWLENHGTSDTPVIEGLQALDWRMTMAAVEKLVLHTAEGDSNSASSFRPVDEPLAPGAKVTHAPSGGRSSEGAWPFFNLEWSGGGLAAAVGWSGQWQASLERDADGARVVCGQQLTHFKLHPGEKVRTPRMLLVFWKGDDPARGTNLLRQAILAHYTPRRNGEIVFAPICGTTNSPKPDDTYTTYKLRAFPQMAKLGFEVLWSDCDPEQWYPIGFPSGTGTWDPDPAKYPNGFKPIGEASRKSGVGFLLWFEPERVHPGSRIDREKPEWVMRANGEWSQLFRLQDPAARKWLTDYVDKQVSDAQLQWMRWDFNVPPLGFWRREDAPDRQGITENLYIQGLYAMWDDLLARHPGMFVDMCASGGRRIDLETLSRGLPLWHSDMQCDGAHPAGDQLQNAGLNRWIPFHGCLAVGNEPDYTFRSAMTAGNIMITPTCGSTPTVAQADATAVSRSIALYKKLRPFFLGDYCELLPHDAGEDKWFAYQYHRTDLDGGFIMAFRRAQCGADSVELALRQLNERASYVVTFEDTGETKTMAGRALARLRVEVKSKQGSAIVTYRRRQARRTRLRCSAPIAAMPANSAPAIPGSGTTVIVASIGVLPPAFVSVYRPTAKSTVSPNWTGRTKSKLPESGEFQTGELFSLNHTSMAPKSPGRNWPATRIWPTAQAGVVKRMMSTCPPKPG